MTEKMWYSIDECYDSVKTLYREGLTKGAYCGFNSLDEFYSLKKGGTTYLYGSPTSGKTEFWLEVLMTTSELHGYKHVVYLPESGNRDNIIAELISKYAKKPFYKDYKNHLTQQELDMYLPALNNHFYIIDPKDKAITIQTFFEQVADIEKKKGIKIDTTCIDPWNELKHDFTEDGRQDLYIEAKLGSIRANAETFNRHNVVITHTKTQAPTEGTHMNGGKMFYLPIPTTNDIAGGPSWFRKAMMLIAVWRHPQGLINKETGAPFADNEVQIVIQKFKPKGTGKKGTVKLFYDLQKNRYYEMENGSPRYSGKKLLPIHQVQTTYQL